MKKTLVALAVLSSVTGAMAEATISGLFQLGTNNTTTTISGSSTTATMLEDSNFNTAVNFTDVEDLGDGIKATMVIGLLPGTNSATAAGQTTFVALSGAFGELKAGKFGNDQFWTIVAGDATGYMGSNAAVVNTAFGSSSTTVTAVSGGPTTSATTIGTQEVWTADQLRYQLPTFVPGLTLAYTNKLGEASTTANGTQTVLAGYTVGAFNAQVASSQFKATTALTDTLNSFAASYDFGPAKLFLLSTSAKIDSVGTVTGRNIGVSVPLGAITLMYNSSAADGRLYSRAITAVDQTNQEVAVTYAFSKRTTGWIYANKYDGASTGQLGSGIATATSGFTSTRFMILHAF